MTQGAQPGAMWQPRGRDGMGFKERFRREGTCVYLWLIHVDVMTETNIMF